MRISPSPPLCSLVVPLFNKERTIESCLASAREQSVSSLEIIVVDDGSSDGGAALVQQVAAQDGRVRLISQANGGPSAARNVGLQAARGSYVAFLDADDRLAPGFFEELIALITREHAAAARCAQLFVEGTLDEKSGKGGKNQHIRSVSGQDSTLPGGALYRRLFADVDVPLMSASSALYKRDVLARYQIHFNEELRHLEDILFVAQLYARDLRIALSSQALYIYQHQTGSSLSDDRTDLAATLPPFVAALEKLEGGSTVATAERQARLRYCLLVILTVLASPAPRTAEGATAAGEAEAADAAAKAGTFYRDFLRSELVRNLCALAQPELIPSSLSIALNLARRDNPRALNAYCATLARARHVRKLLRS